MDKKEHPKRMDYLKKHQLDDLNIAEARGWVIDEFHDIEFRIDSIIVNFFKPVDANRFNRIVLNSSIIDVGSKLKILSNIGTIDKQMVEKIRKIAAIRNGFAHAPINEHVIINVDEIKNSTTLVVETRIEVMNSQGEIKSKIALDYLREFSTLCDDVRKTI